MVDDVIILGAGFVTAGHFRKVSINGTASISGEVTAENFNVNGAAKASGGVTADKIEVNGTLNGTALKGRKIIIRGVSDLSGTVESEQFELNGCIKCQSVNADQVEIKLKGHANIGELVGSKISVRVKEPTLTILNLQLKPSVLYSKMIEADEIYLEHTEADVVSGNIVQIGRGCRIGRVEYRESLKVANESAVDQIVKD